MPVPFRVVALHGGAEPAEPLAESLRALIEGAGHHLVATVLASQDDLAHEALQARSFRGITLLCGGDQPDAVVAAARDQIDRERVGVAELYRQRLFAELGAPAALAELACGPCGDGVLVAVPGGEAQARVALTEVLLPMAGALVPDAATPEPAPSSTEVGGIHLSQMGTEAPPPPPEAPASSGWEAGLRAMGGKLDRDRFPPMPDAFARLAPARQVLDTAGERGTVNLPDGRQYAAFGWPDLLRGRSKVLLIAEGQPLVEVIALHRFPRKVGVCVEGPSTWLPGADYDPDGPAIERTGAPCPTFGTLFAVEGASVMTTRDRKVWSWDGRHERDEGTPSQALASLLLRWSQK